MFANVVEVVHSHLQAAKGQVLVLELRVMLCIASPGSVSFATSASGRDFCGDPRSLEAFFAVATLSVAQRPSALLGWIPCPA